MAPKTVALVAMLEFLAAGARASDSDFDLKNDLALGHRRAVHVSAPAESDRAAVKIPALPHANLPGLDKNMADTDPPFTCMQLLVIDELELLGEAADCD